MRGRPTKLTEFTQAKIVALLREGNHRSTSCEAAGVDINTFKRWMSDPRPLYQTFRAAVIRAEADWEIEIVSHIKTASVEDPKIALELLARRHPEKWAATTRVAIEQMVRNEAQYLANELGLDEEALVAEAEAILARNG